MAGGSYCGPELRQQAAASSTLLVVAVGIAAVAAAMSVPPEPSAMGVRVGHRWCCAR